MLRDLLRRIARAPQPEVTVCIPAWQAEPFIERTLLCARRQTHARLRILVSVDASDDATAEICQRHAGADARISVFVQPERLGWAGNVNFLLDKVETEYYFLYFHDDILEPSYTARLVEALAARPDAASAHCDMGHFGEATSDSVGRSYEGSAAERLATYLAAPTRGSPLRSMTRREVVGKIRFPADVPAGLWAHEPYLMELIAAGPALRVPEILYRRWNKRGGSLTDGWRTLTVEERQRALRVVSELALGIARRAGSSEAEREVLRFCVFLYFARKYIEKMAASEVIASFEALHDAYAGFAPPAGLDAMDPKVREWARAGYAEVCRRVTQGTR